MDTRTSQLAPGLARMFALLSFCAIGAPTIHAQSAAHAAPVHWTKVSVDLPADSLAFPAGDGALIANENCLMCHSAGMVLRQPPFTQSQWLAEIRKMRAMFGAPMPADQDAPLAQYLARINGPATARQVPAPRPAARPASTGK